MQLIIEFKDECERITAYYPVEKDCFRKIEGGYRELERKLGKFPITCYLKKDCV